MALGTLIKSTRRIRIFFLGGYIYQVVTHVLDLLIRSKCVTYSIGSLGANGSEAMAENIWVFNCSFTNTMNGARVKTWQVFWLNFEEAAAIEIARKTFILFVNLWCRLFFQGGSGYARNISFEHIRFNSVDVPIIIDQYYCNGEQNCTNSVTRFYCFYLYAPACTHTHTYVCRSESLAIASLTPNFPMLLNAQTSAVKVSDVSFVDALGTCSNDVAIKLACSETVACTGIVLRDVNITTASGSYKESSYCLNAFGTELGQVSPAVSCLSTTTN